MPTLSGPMQAAVAALGTFPGWLVAIGATPTRISSFGDVTAMGLAWTGASFRIGGLGQDGNLQAGGRIEFDDGDGAWNASHLLGELSDVRCQVWAADAAALAVGDPVFVFDGSLDNSRAQYAAGTVTADLVPARPGRLKTPRMKIGPQTGITTQIPVGTVLRIGSVTITVEDPRA